jgi:hypothetical protein
MKTLFLVVGVLLTAIAVAFSESTVALVAIVALLAAWAERRSPRGQHTGTLRHVMRFAGLVSMVLLVMLASRGGTRGRPRQTRSMTPPT